MLIAVSAPFTTSVDTVDRNYKIALLRSELVLHKQIAEDSSQGNRIIAASLSMVADRY